jgi:hypothetical protein
VIEQVIHGHRANEAVGLIDHGDGDQVVRGQPFRDLDDWRGRIQWIDPLVDDAAEHRGRRLAQQPLEVHHSEIAAGRRSGGRTCDENLRRHGRGELLFPDSGQGLRHGRVRGHDHRLRRHEAAGRTGLIGQQRPYRRGFLGFHEIEQLLLVQLGQLGQQVGGVVGIHLLQYVRRAVAIQRREDLDLVMLGQLAQHVGQAFVVERRGDLVAPGVGHVLEHVRDVGGASSIISSSEAVPCACLDIEQPAHLTPVELPQLPAPAQPPVTSRTATRVSAH